MTNIERREATLELRVAKSETDSPKIEGYSAVFGQLSSDLGGFREQIAPGAFAESIKSHDIRALFNHDPNAVLGRNKAGTLVLSEDDNGLFMRVNPPDTQWARDVVALIERGDVTGQSFSFVVEEDSWDKQDAGWTRTLKKVRLYDVGPVTFPAYPQTDASVRSAFDQVISREREKEQLAREARARLLALAGLE